MKEKLVKKVLEVYRHRNGVSGLGFYAVRFLADPDQSCLSHVKNIEFLGIVADAEKAADSECFVICTALIPIYGVGDDNRWRGDAFKPELLAAVKKHERAENKRWLEQKINGHLGPF